MVDTLRQALPIVLGLFGLLFGSFANVVIWRVPRGESIVSPGSHCPSCGCPIRWYDNIPLVSWLVLRGRCRGCGTTIAWRYPLVELLSGLLWASAGVAFGLSWRTPACVVLFYLLLLLAFIDLDTYRLPNPLVGALAGIGVAGVVIAQFSGTSVLPLLGGEASGFWAGPLATALLGVLLGAGLSGGLAVVYGRLRGRSGLGAGDVKLLGAMGLFLGPYVLMVLFLGSLVGAIVGVIGARRAGEDAGAHRIPFGPFLALGGVVTALAGPALWRGYMALLGAS